MWKRLTSILLLLGFSIQSLALQDRYGSPKFFLKSSIDLRGGNYSPLKVFYQVDENFLNNPELNKTISSAAKISLKVLSNLVLSSLQKPIIKLGDNIKCIDLWIKNIIKNQKTDADLYLYITFSNNLEDDLIETDKCENESQHFFISAIINPKKFLALEQISQVKMFASNLASIIFKDNLDRSQLIREADEYLNSHSLDFFSATINKSYCKPPIDNCDRCYFAPDKCDWCIDDYNLNEDDTQCCVNEHCGTCNNGVDCDSCISGWYLDDGKCIYCSFYNCGVCDATTCFQCKPGSYLYDGECYWCENGCEECYRTDNGLTCNKCFDPANSILVDNKCICTKPLTDWNYYGKCNCIPGYYNDLNGVCQLCNVGCETCKDRAYCSTCFDYFAMTKNNDGTCSCTDSLMTYNTTSHLCECPKGQYADRNTKPYTCKPCPNGCAECENKITCYSCVSDILKLSWGKCYCPQQNQIWNYTTQSCVACPKYTFNSMGEECVSCDPCKECNPTSDYCTACYPGMSLWMSQCRCSIPNKVFDPITKTCVYPIYSEYESGCDEECNICRSPEVCEVCHDPENMVNQNGVCSCRNSNHKFSISEKKCENYS